MQTVTTGKSDPWKDHLGVDLEKSDDPPLWGRKLTMARPMDCLPLIGQDFVDLSLPVQ